MCLFCFIESEKNLCSDWAVTAVKSGAPEKTFRKLKKNRFFSPRYFLTVLALGWPIIEESTDS